MAPEPLPAACLAGPTGCGKTALAIKLAKICGCEVVNADSRQLYRDFPVITAQPGQAEMEGLPHHLYGILETGEKLDAAAWARLGAAKAAEILRRGKIPLFVGGSGFYLGALFEGLSDIPRVPREISEAIGAEMDRLGSGCLYKRLARADPAATAKIHPHDRQRIMRGLEVLEATGRPLSFWQRRPPRPLCAGPMLFMDIGLEELTPFLAERIEAMLARGARAEALAAFSRCPDPAAPGWSGIGCLQALEMAKSDGESGERKAAWLLETRKYAKRQLTWFRNKKGFTPFRKEPPERLIDGIRALGSLGGHL